ncbi:type II secretion system F family protein, partial [Nocardia mangyaensis]|uniref:type II secretion system F family protein n=1 Tax=Nocardia mangyaensis TaxID=2213200 RepID=UPI0026763093
LPKITEFLLSINPIKLKKIKAQEIIELFENLHLIIKAGVPLSVGLKDLEESIENKKLKSVLKDIHFSINSGMSISDSFKRHESVFGPVITTLIKVGEETGNLDKVLKDSANYLARIEDIKSKTKQALIYPGFTFITVLGSMIFWMVYVLPQIIEAFKNFNMELPLMTKILIAMSEFTRKYIVFIILGIIIAIGILNFLRKTNPKVKL